MHLSKIQEQVLHTLVDRHEKRKDYGAGERSPRRTAVRIDRRRFPDYFHVSDAGFRRLFNAEMMQLRRHGLVELDWEPFNEGEALRRVVLVEEALPEIYRLLDRTSLDRLYTSAATLLAAWQTKAPPELASFYRIAMAKLENLEPLPSPLKPDKPEELEQILKALHAFFEPRRQEIARRLLSVRLFGDSKRWAELEKPLLNLLRSYCLSEAEAAAGDAAILAERGIVDNPVHINLSGPLVFSTQKGRVDLSLFYPDLGLSPEMAADLAVEECDAAAVVTVENKTSFYQYIREGPTGHLVIYLGGYHNSPRRKLLQALHRFLLKRDHHHPVPFYHWGDLDLGGLTIYKNLVEKTGIPFQPLFMDERIYLEHLHLGQPLNEAYCRRLAPLLEDPALAVFHPLIRRMLREKIRVEQEAVQINNDGIL